MSRNSNNEKIFLYLNSYMRKFRTTTIFFSLHRRIILEHSTTVFVFHFFITKIINRPQVKIYDYEFYCEYRKLLKFKDK